MCVAYVTVDINNDDDYLFPWGGAPLQKLRVRQPTKEFRSFCGIRTFIIVFIRAHRLFLSWARLIQFTLPPLCFKYIDNNITNDIFVTYS